MLNKMVYRPYKTNVDLSNCYQLSYQIPENKQIHKSQSE